MFGKIKKFLRSVATMQRQVTEINKRLEVLSQVAMNPILGEIRSFVQDKQLGYLETVEYVRKNKISFARFGDGELKAMLRPDHHLKFQKNTAGLGDGLSATVAFATKNPKKLFIGFPHIFHEPHWLAVWADIWGETKASFGGLKVVGDAHVSRPIYFEQFGKTGVEAWRAIWKDQTVTVITGKGSRFEIIDELFNETKSVDFIYSKPRDAFEDIERVIDEVKKSDSDIFLISLGPAGTVLAYRLAELGKWALDIGHLSDSYNNVFHAAPRPEANPIVRSHR